MSEAAIVALVFLLAGAVKGVIGLGLPTVALGLLTALIGLEPAMALMLAPSFATNVWQAVVGGHFLAALRRIWPFLLGATVTVWIGVSVGAAWNTDMLAGLLGALLVVYGVSGIARPPVAIHSGREAWAGPVVGGLNGIFTGLTGSFVVPGVLYLQSLALPREQLIQAMGMLFTLSTVALAVALAGDGRLPLQTGFASALAVLPAVAGMMVGSRIRRRLTEATFRRIFLWSLIVLGLYILGRSAVAFA